LNKICLKHKGKEVSKRGRMILGYTQIKRFGRTEGGNSTNKTLLTL
jgi:hypothetical protein